MTTPGREDRLTWLAFAALVLWPASRASYQFVIFPIGAVVLSSFLDREPLTLALLLGGVLVTSGVYVGTLAPSSAR